MKTKKYLAALLALVMLLSILPMSAFAAERALTCPNCGSLENKTKITSTTYDCITKTHHRATYARKIYCLHCGEQVGLAPSLQETQLHVEVIVVQVDSGSEGGDEYVVLEHRCVCGYVMETETIWDYET